MIDALANSVTPAVSVNNEVRTLDNLHPDVRLILEEITRFLNMEKLLPSYRHTITVRYDSVLRFLKSSLGIGMVAEQVKPSRTGIPCCGQ